MYLEIRGKKVDSAKVERNCFTLVGKQELEAPEHVVVCHSNKGWRCKFWMCNDHVDITTANGKPVVKGSKTQDEYEEFQRTLEPVWNYGYQLKEQMKDVSKADSIMHIVETVFKEKSDSAFMVFARNNPSSYIALNYICNKRGKDKYPFSKYSEMARILTPGAFKGKQWSMFQDIYKKDEALEPGQKMPPFVMDDLYGKPIDIAAMKGKYVLLTISSSGMEDYDNDLPLRKRLYDKLSKQGLEMVDYSLGNDEISIIKCPANMGLRWHFVTDFKGFRGPWLEEHAIDYITQNFLIDRNGTIIGRNLFGKDLEREINKLFN